MMNANVFNASMNGFNIIADGFEVTINSINEKMKDRSQLLGEFSSMFKFHPTLADFNEDEEQLFYENLMTQEVGIQAVHDIYPLDSLKNNSHEEQILSQEFSQLSMMNENQTAVNEKVSSPINLSDRRKRFCRSANLNDPDENMPSYLLAKNKLFETRIENYMNTMTSISSFHIEDLRQIAFYLHQIGIYERLYHLWLCYSKSGQGKLNETSLNLSSDVATRRPQRYWPKQLTSLIYKNENIKQMSREDQNVVCEKIVDDYLQQYEEKLNYYKQQYEEKESQLTGFTLSLKEAIKIFVEHYGVMQIRLKCDYMTALLHNEHEDYQLQTIYAQENPTDYQIQIGKRLYDLVYQLEHLKCDLRIHRQHLLYNRPPSSYIPLQIPLPSCSNSLQIPQQRHNYIQQYKRIIERTKTDLMLLCLMVLEATICQYEINFNQENKTMLENHQQLVSNKEMTPLLIDIIEQRAKLIQKNFQLKSDFYTNYHLHSSFRQNNEKNFDQNNFNLINMKEENIGFTTNLFIDPSIPNESFKDFHLQEFKLLNRGPSYIPPCQLQIVASLAPSLNTAVLWKQYAPLEQQLLVSLNEKNNAIDPQESQRIQENIKSEFQTLFSFPSIPISIRERAFYEHSLIKSIQQVMKQQNVVLRRTAQGQNQFYLLNKTVFEQKCQEFMSKHHSDFELIGDVINEEIARINTKIETLFQQKHISKEIKEELYVKSTDIQLGYLYFLPENYDQDIFVKPIFSMANSLTWNLANFLTRLLRSITPSLYEKLMIVENENDFMEKFQRYCSIPYRLRSTSLFVHIKVKNFYTMFSYQSIIDRVGYALTNDRSNAPIHHLSIVTIERLIELFLKFNLFYYDGKFYRCTHGLSSSFELTDILLNLALYSWQKMIINYSKLKTDFIARCQDELFFTWNDSQKELEIFLQLIRDKYNEIDLKIEWGYSIHYLDIYLENRQGHLYRSMFHPNDKSSKLILPYVVGHPIVNYGQWFRSALCRTVQLCSNYNDFLRERLYLEMSCLVYGYPVDFIEYELKKFYDYFQMKEVDRFGMTKQLYETLRQRCRLNFSNMQQQLKKQQLDFDIHKPILDFYYFYDYGCYEQFERKFHYHWSRVMKQNRKLQNMKVVLHVKHLFSLNTLLAQQRPPRLDPLFK